MNEELIAYYVNLLILQYRTKTKAPDTIEALITQLMIFDLIEAVENGFDISTAVGVQLDILAKYLNADRAVNPPSLTGSFFGSIRESQVLPTESVCGSIRNDEATLPPFQQLTYETNISISLLLNDTDFRILLQATRDFNSNKQSASFVYLFLNTFFPNNVIFVDNKNMTIIYIFPEAARFFAEIFAEDNVLPKPAGVGLTVTFVSELANLFSLLSYDAQSIPSYANGFLRYGDTPIGEWLQYN